ncbi:MAG: bacteriohemerythrin [Treponema sp.]|jgi:hemerythrin|nr:bacteriohemerythrin [Treponema sp.]
MTVKTDPADELVKAGSKDVVAWSEKYATGIALIDQQHRELVNLTNHLFLACLTGREAIKAIFKDTMHRMVDYVRFHFSTELEMLKRINYPGYDEHKKEHETLVKKILEASNDYDSGKTFTPNSFVRTLKDWVFGHIALTDKHYAAYVADQKQKGLLTDRQINGENQITAPH